MYSPNNFLGITAVCSLYPLVSRAYALSSHRSQLFVIVATPKKTWIMFLETVIIVMFYHSATSVFLNVLLLIIGVFLRYSLDILPL